LWRAQALLACKLAVLRERAKREGSPEEHKPVGGHAHLCAKLLLPSAVEVVALHRKKLYDMISNDKILDRILNLYCKIMSKIEIID